MIKFYGQNDHTTFVIELTKKFGQLNDRTFDFQSFDWTVFGQLIITVIIIINKRCLHAKSVTGFAWRHQSYYQSSLIYMIAVICDSLN